MWIQHEVVTDRKALPLLDVRVSNRNLNSHPMHCNQWFKDSGRERLG
jgi:hypothetical protein